jgi:chromosome partitioning protein
VTGCVAEELAEGRKDHSRGHICAIVNQKGGVGKSTTAVNLGASLAFLGYRVLLVDMDPQGNSTSGLGISKIGLTCTTYDVLMGEVPIKEAILKTSVSRLEIVPSDLRLAGAEVELVPQIEREGKLREAISGVRPCYAAVVIDCPPSLGLLTVNALVAADSCIIPVQCEFYALEGLAQLIDTVSLVRKHLNPNLAVSGVVLTMTSSRTKLSEQVASEVRRHLGSLVFSTEIPRSVRLAEAPSYGKPVIQYAPSSRASSAYLELAHEFLERVARDGGAKGERGDVTTDELGADPLAGDPYCDRDVRRESSGEGVSQ